MERTELKVEDHIADIRYEELRKNFARHLKEYPEEDRFKFIKAALPYDALGALKLANSCLRRREYFVELFEQGLHEADASSILMWLECLVPRLGVMRVLNILSDKLNTEPKQVRKAIYWLPKFIKREDTKAAPSFHTLKEMTLKKLGETTEIPPEI
jgi:hypothetical protein